MDYKTLLFTKEETIALITLNRPEKLNALNHLTLQELNQVFELIAEDDQIKGVLLGAAGGKAFVAGADISEIRSLSLEKGKEFARFGQEIFSRIEHFPKPVVALIDGYALGGGCELAMACHLRLATEKSKFGQPEVSLGLIPGYGGTQRLPRLIGKSAALELLLTGGMIPAERALQLGLVNKILPAESLLEEGKALMNSILSQAPLAVKYVLETVNRGLDMPLAKALRLEADYFGMACASEDMKEGTGAFLEKRKANFQGK